MPMSSNIIFIGQDSHIRPWLGGHGTRRTPANGTPAAKFRDWLLILLVFAGWPASAAPAHDDGAERLRQRLELLTTTEPNDGAVVRFAAPSVLHGFYQSRDFAFAWNDDTARALIAMVTDAQSHGLDPADYLVQQLAALPPLSTLPGSMRDDADLLLTEAFLRFAYHCRFGKVDPNSIETTWNYARYVSPGGPFVALNRILGAADFSGQFMQEMGHGPVYDAMRLLLARYRVFAADGGWQELVLGPTLHPDDEGPRVTALRKRLTAEGYQASPATPDAAPRFDPALVAAVQVFQRTHGLDDDGLVGKRSLEALNVSVGDRIEQIRVNLERLRWVLIDRAPRFIVVNIAGFRVYYIEDDMPKWSARAVVGRPYRATPVFHAEMKYVVLNPDWIVPPTILRKDVLPAMHEDRAYLTEHRMEVIDAKRRFIDPSSIDWSLYPSTRFPYQIRQRPGPTNSLGRIKFVFPNPHFVYLHDTPAKELFEKPDRVFSSGCIRVENPLELAGILLQSKPGWDRAAIEAAIATEVTRTVFLDETIPVLLLYLSVVAFDNGREFAFYRDVYRRDAQLRAALDQDFVYVPPDGMPDFGS
jgi:L,D-transpeptidase YcbB